MVEKTNTICSYKTSSRCTLSETEIEDLNCFFGHLCTDNDYHKPEFIPIPSYAEIPRASEMQVWRSLLGLTCIKTATGSDQIPFWIWRDHAEILTPVVTKIWNLSLETHVWPGSWNSANITPIPKVEIPKENGDFRGINITPVVARAFKKVVYKSYVKNIVESSLSPTQFAHREDGSCTGALLTMQYHILRTFS